MRILLLILLPAFLSPLVAQESQWSALSKVTYRQAYDDILGINVDLPVFSPKVKALEGEVITLKGYIVPTDGYKSHTEFVFSAYPYSMCFFCGGAGPETVIEVHSLEPVTFTVEPVTIQGILSLNDDDVNQLMYRLDDVRQID